MKRSRFEYLALPGKKKSSLAGSPGALKRQACHASGISRCGKENPSRPGRMSVSHKRQDVPSHHHGYIQRTAVAPAVHWLRHAKMYCRSMYCAVPLSARQRLSSNTIQDPTPKCARLKATYILLSDYDAFRFRQTRRVAKKTKKEMCGKLYRHVEANGP